MTRTRADNPCWRFVAVRCFRVWAGMFDLRGAGAMVVACALAMTCVGGRALAQPSGLNNIPTADTTPDLTLVLQGFTNFGEGRKPDYSTGFKFGLEPHESIGLEMGLLGRLAPSDTQNLTVHAKAAFSVSKDWPRLALGIANVAFTAEDRDDAGDEYPYLVLSHDLSSFRVHAGYGFQDDNEGAFFGLDRTFSIKEWPLTLRGDVIQTEDQSDWMGSVGVMFPIFDGLVAEAWWSQPFDNGDAVFTLKLNYVIRF